MWKTGAESLYCLFRISFKDHGSEPKRHLQEGVLAYWRNYLQDCQGIGLIIILFKRNVRVVKLSNSF